MSKVDIEDQRRDNTIYPGYIAFKLSTLYAGTLAPCDIYCAVSLPREGYARLITVIKSGSRIQAAQLTSLEGKGLSDCFVRNSDSEQLQAYMFDISADDQLEQSPEKRLAVLHESALCAIKAAMLEPRNGRRLAMGVRVVRRLIDTVWNSRMSCQQLLDIMTKDHRIYNHSLKSCLLGAGFCQFMRQDRNQVESLAIAMFFHDLGLVDKPDSVAAKGGIDLNAEESDPSHPTRSKDYLSQLPDLSPVVLDTVQNHHECMDATGFPRAIGSKQLTIESRIARIVDFYELKTSGHEKESTPFEALRQMNIEMAEKFDANLVQQFIRYLGRV